MAEVNLTQATIQDIQLELIRRHRHNSFDGRRVAADLLAHREWWEAALIDRMDDLIKLRDLADNTWNVDTLFILATDTRNAWRLAELAEDWEADTVEVFEQEATKRELGGGIEQQRLIIMWWD
jgi:hypothetical protein